MVTQAVVMALLVITNLSNGQVTTQILPMSTCMSVAFKLLMDDSSNTSASCEEIK